MFRVVLASILFILVNQSGYTQALSPAGSFSKDSLKIGEEVDYSLSIRYPQNLDVVFPDSTFTFLPFEIIRKVAYPTRSDSLFSFDSAVYTLTTFEIDSIQTLELPIFIVTKGDSTVVSPGADSIFLHHVVASIPDSVAMIENTAFSNVRLGFNYPYYIVGITALALISIIILLVFGKSIRKKILLFRLQRMHRRFLEKFTIAVRDLKTEHDYRHFEHLLSEWKGYMEKLNKAPFTKLTSKEIQMVYPDKELTDSLHNIDRVIYGRFEDTSIPGSFDYLRRVSEDSFHNKVEEIKNG